MNWISILVRVHEAAIGGAIRKLQEMPEVEGIEIAVTRVSHPLQPLLEQLASAPPLAPKKASAKTLRGGRPRKDGAAGALLQSLQVMGETEISVLRGVMIKKGYSSKGLSGLIHRLLSNKQITRTKPKTYKLTSKGEKELADHKEVKKKTELKKFQKYLGKKINNSIGVRGLILSSLKSAPKDGTYLRGLLESNNLSPTNMTGTVAKMIREGLVKSEKGQYTLTDRGTNAASANGASQ